VRKPTLVRGASVLIKVSVFYFMGYIFVKASNAATNSTDIETVPNMDNKNNNAKNWVYTAPAPTAITPRRMYVAKVTIRLSKYFMDFSL
jgi:hypothetical protein